MCGGSGSRLWPLSRETLPKQFLNLTDTKYTMFQLTCIRATSLNYQTLFIICNEQHMFIAKQQLNELNITNFKLLGEPFGKNTCAAISVACQLTSQNDNLLIMSADHIWDDDIFIKSVNKGLELIEEGIVVFGIKPMYPETGYGYLHISGNKLIKFIEKPNKEKAEEYFKNGNYLWNSGNFLFSNKIMTKESIKNAKDINDAITITLEKSGDLSKSEIILSKEYFTPLDI